MPEIIVKLGDNIVQKYFFTHETMNIGRSTDNEIVIENLAVSRNHATISYENGSYMLEDHGSSNGCYVNGVRAKHAELLNKDIITVGKHKLYFYLPENAEKKQAQAPPSENLDQTMLMTPTINAQLEIVKGKQKGMIFSLGNNEYAIGRATNSDIRINDWFVSKNHAVIEKRGVDFYLRDLGSWRHTYVNGAVINEVKLNNNDNIQLGPSVALAFTLDVPEELAAGARQPLDPVAASSAAVDQYVPPIEEEEPPTVEHVGPLPEPVPMEPPAPASEWEDEDDEEYAEAEAELNEESENLDDLVEDIVEVSVNAAVEDTGWDLDSEDEEEEPAQEKLEEPVQNMADSDPAEASDAEESSQEAPDAEQAEQIAIWERALENKSPIIRKQAARQLKKLTGKDYDY